MATPEDLDAALAQVTAELASLREERARLMGELRAAITDVRHLHETYSARLTDLKTPQAELERTLTDARTRLDALSAPPDTPPPALPAAALQRLDDLGALLGYPPLTAQEAQS